MPDLPADHDARLARARASLRGLAVGDGFGQRFFAPYLATPEALEQRQDPPGPYYWTDDTAMAIEIVATLQAHGAVDQDDLARRFANRYVKEPERGYGSGAAHILTAIAHSIPWEEASRDAFGGQGSYGNGGAMRAAPLGAYFADDPQRAAVEGLLAAEVTHAHPEGQAGGAAVAAAAALAWQYRNRWPLVPDGFLQQVAELTPGGEVTEGLEEAARLPDDATVAGAVLTLGNGTRASAPDTVPFSVWAAARYGKTFREALWQTVSGLGDRDTTCAIVGGIVVLARGEGDLPPEWLELAEALPNHVMGEA